MANEIKIRAKKISDLNQQPDFNFDTYGGETYLIVAYKPTATGGTASNFRISIKSIIDKLKDSITGMTDEEFKTQLVSVLQNYEDVKNALVTKSVLDWAREHGFSGSDAELWQMFQNGSGSTPTEPEEPEVISVSSVSISGSTAALAVGSTRNLSAVITPSNATNKNVVWTSSNSNIATVNSSGKVIAISPGQVTITVKTDDDAHTNSVNIQIESATPADTTNYLFSYASELQEGIFTKDANDTIVGVSVAALKGLSYTQEVMGKVPTTNKNGHGFCLQDFNTTYSESYTWDDTVLNGRVWIILPAKFYNISQNNFIDEKNGKWKFVDPMMKNPMDCPVDPITITGLYEGQDYVLVCFSEEGQVDKQYFKKIG